MNAIRLTAAVLAAAAALLTGASVAVAAAPTSAGTVTVQDGTPWE